MREELEKRLTDAVGALLRRAGDPDPPPPITVEAPRSNEHGDFACNAALVLAKRLRRAPRDIAEELIETLGDAGGLVARAELAGPGFVNLWLGGDRWREVLQRILAEGDVYGRSDAGKNERIQVEFVSCNPTGPVSVGHGRQGVLGDCIARLLEAVGFAVTREYYFNNGGRQMRVLGESLRARYLERIGREAEFPEDGYQGEYLREIADSLHAAHGDSLADEAADGFFREHAEKEIFADIRGTLDRMGIAFDVYYNEASLYTDGKIEEALADLRATGLVDEAEGAVWFRATRLGLDRDRVLVRSNGEPTYLLPDIAYHREKFRRGFERVIDVQGADHIEQFPSVRAAAGALGCDPDRIELVMHQFVTLTAGGRTVKQSTRKATFVTTDEVIDDVGADVFRFFMIQRKPDGHLDFDLDLARDTDWKKNPAYYVQYAHARAHGIERKAAEAGVPLPELDDIPAARLDLPEEIELMKKLGEFPELVARASEAREPHHIAYYLRDLAGLWNPYVQDGTRHRVLSDDAALTAARLGLVLAVRTVLRNGLALLGVSAPERM